MTRFDLHTHIGTDPFGIVEKWVLFNYTQANLSKALTENKIDHAVTFPMPYYSRGNYIFSNKVIGNVPYFVENLSVMNAAEADKRILPFVAVDTRNSSSVESAKLFVEKGAKGIKFHGNGIGTCISSLENFGLVDFIEKKDIPVVVHTDFIRGCGPDEKYKYFADPLELLDLAKRHPKVHFLSAHSGILSERYLNELMNVDNVWADCSPINYLCTTDYFIAPDRIKTDYSNPVKVVEDLYEIIGDKLVVGSDTPYHLMAKASYRDGITVFDSLDKGIANRIFNDNARRFLKR